MKENDEATPQSLEDTWKADQAGNTLFRGGGDGSQADRMLQYGGINKTLGDKQARLIIAARFWDTANPEIRLLGGLCAAVEVAQMAVGAQARREFMKVAIEQWQGKIEAKKPSMGKSLS